MAIFIIERNDKADLEIEAERAEKATDGSSRVTFYDADDKPVGEFINVQGWHQKPAS